jgi:hypothetical protein
MGKSREKRRRKGCLKPRVDYVIFTSSDGSNSKFISKKNVRKQGVRHA